jgi:hypothetical protein
MIKPVSLDACESAFLIIKFNETETRIEIEVADSHLKRKQGLMFRERLNPRAGMFFVYDYPQKVGFWMKNTKIPLDIAFTDSTGLVVRVAYNTEPFSLDVIDGGEKIQYVLEINAGMSEELNLFEGSKLVHPYINRKNLTPC